MTIRIIDGKRYNTDSATEVADWSNNYYPGDFEHCREALYLTPKGSWFTCGSGGAMSKYSRPAFGGGLTGDSEVITPLSPDEALAWLEERDELEAIERYFGDNVEDA